MTPCRLIVDPPLDGAWNMAVDEALLEEAAGRGMATLRFYRWREPTLSLGYFQPYRERQLHQSSRAAAVVRRLTGGGALLHDRELTYSLCLPTSHPLARQSQALYRIAHQTLIDVLADVDVRAAMVEQTAGVAEAAPGRAEPFLCFERRTDADVVTWTAGGASAASKIAGSAQRRRRGAVLQHGGVLLDRSPSAPELPGLEQTSGSRLGADELARRWQRGLSDALEVELVHGSLEGELLQLAEQLRSEKYAAAAWTERR